MLGSLFASYQLFSFVDYFCFIFLFSFFLNPRVYCFSTSSSVATRLNCWIGDEQQRKSFIFFFFSSKHVKTARVTFFPPPLCSQSSSRPALSLPPLSTRTLQHPTFLPVYLSADRELPKNHTGDLAALASAPWGFRARSGGSTRWLVGYDEGPNSRLVNRANGRKCNVLLMSIENDAKQGSDKNDFEDPWYSVLDSENTVISRNYSCFMSEWVSIWFYLFILDWIGLNRVLVDSRLQFVNVPPDVSNLIPSPVHHACRVLLHGPHPELWQEDAKFSERAEGECNQWTSSKKSCLKQYA